MTTKKYRSKEGHYPVEAAQLNAANAQALTEWCSGVFVVEHHALQHDITYPAINVPTADGMKRAQEGDWIVLRRSGYFHPIAPDMFEALFEPDE